MKKFFRVALVCALAGATLLYTGCTKDYSEDLRTLQKTVDSQGNTITTLTDQVNALITAKASLEEADRKANEAITGLKTSVGNLEKEVDSLKAEKTRLEGLITKNAGDIADLKDSLAKVDSLIGVINGQISKINGEIDTLKTTVKNHEAALDSISKELAKKADKTYVDTELGKKADKSWVEETLKNYATVKALDDTAAALRAELMKINKDIFDIKNQLIELNNGLTALGTRMNRVADSVATNAADIKTINATIATMQEKIDTLESDMSKAKADIITAQETADKAVEDAGKAMKFAQGLEKFLKENYYPKTTVDKLLGAKADTALVNPKFREIDARFAEVVAAYQEADSLLDVKIDSLDAAITDLLGTKVDTTTFNEAIKAIWAEFEAVENDIDKLFARVQSIVYVPDYDDNRITLDWAQLHEQSFFDTRTVEEIPASFDVPAWIALAKELLGDIPAALQGEVKEIAERAPSSYEETYWAAFTPIAWLYGYFSDDEEWNGYKASEFVSGYETPVPEQSHIKYRIYGTDADGIVEGLVNNYEALSFDVIRVGTRANADEIALNIVGAKNCGNGVIDLTVMPENVPNDFWFYTWEVKNTNNPRTHWMYFLSLLEATEGEMSTQLFVWLYQQMVKNVNVGSYDKAIAKAEGEGLSDASATIEEDESFPSFSVSLVFSEGDDKGAAITSGYNNVVPAPVPDQIELIIKRNGEDVTYDLAHEVEIVYTDLEEHEVLNGTSLWFEFKGKEYSAADFAKLGMNLGDPVARFLAVSDYSDAVDSTKLDDDYFVNRADNVTPVAYTKLSKPTPAGVGAEEMMVLAYFVGPACAVTFGTVTVVPDTITVNIDLWESADQEAFKWNYTKDAEIDQAYYFNNPENVPARYDRAGAVAKYDAEAIAAELARTGLKADLSDFVGIEPAAEETEFTFTYVDGEKTVNDVVKLSEIAESAYADFEMEHIITEGVLTVDVDNFPFFDAAKGTATQVAYKAVYYLPDADQPAIKVIVKGKIAIDDRNREPIVITLPVTTKDMEVNLYVEAKDKLFTGDELTEETTVETSFEDHHLAKADIEDAFGEVTTRTWGVFQVNDPVTTTAVLYAPNFAYTNQSGYYANERIDSVAMQLDGKDVKDLARNNTTAHTETEYLADEDAAVVFRTSFKINAFDLRNKLIGPYANYESYLTLWYGQSVIVKKNFVFNNDGIFDYERIPEYVTYNSDEDVFTTLQPLWQPDGTTTDFTKPVASYDANRVLLNQHFRIVDVLNNNTVCTDLQGNILEDYSYLRRRFWLENAEGEKVAEIADPRDYNPDWKVIIDNALTADTPFNEEPNILHYYSKAPQTDVYGDLYIFNDNGSFMVLKTRFDRKAGDETYENYVIKLYDPLKDLVVTNDNEKQLINVNNSITTVTSIYEFLSLKDKRDWELIDATASNGWVLGTGANGFVEGKTSADVYTLSFTHKMKYLTEVSPETQNRITFNEKTGKLYYDNTLQTQLATPIDIQLDINVEYPWGTRTATVVVELYNKPVGE